MLRRVNRNKAEWIGHILRGSHPLKHVIEGRIKGRIHVTERRGIRRKQLLNDLKETKGYCRLKEEAPDRTLLKGTVDRSEEDYGNE